VGEGFPDLAIGVLEVRQLAGEVVIVGGHVQVTVAGEVEEDRLRLACLPASDVS